VKVQHDQPNLIVLGSTCRWASSYQLIVQTGLGRSINYGDQLNINVWSVNVSCGIDSFKTTNDIPSNSNTEPSQATYSIGNLIVTYVVIPFIVTLVVSVTIVLVVFYLLYKKRKWERYQ
jgi:predicted PurR-regulated permease PerM